MRRLTLLVLAVALAACGNGNPTIAEPAGDHLDDSGAEITVVATVFPLAWLAEQIAPDAGVRFLAGSGQDPHGLELSPGDRALLEQADVVIFMGDIGFQPQVEQAVRESTGVTVSVADVAGPTRLLAVDEGHDDHADDHEDDSGQSASLEHGQWDPHVWFDAEVMADVGLAIGEAFATVDGSGGSEYRQRAAALSGELTALATEISGMLADCRLDTVIVSHDAYAYLLRPHGFHEEGISGAGGHGDVSPRRLAELTELIAGSDIDVVLAEPLEGRADAEALAAEAGVGLLEIHPLETAIEGEFATGYPELLRRQAQTFAEALDCD